MKNPNILLQTLALIALALPLRPAIGALVARDERAELVPQSFRIVSERELDDGSVELEIAAQLRNVDSGSWRDAIIWWRDDDASIEVVRGEIRFGAIAPAATVDSTSTMLLIVPSSEAAQAVLAELENSSIDFVVNGTDSVVYASRSVFVDADTDAVFDRIAPIGVNELILFSAWTPLLESLSTGDILAIDTALDGYTPESIPPSALPRKIVSVIEIAEIVHVEVAHLDVSDVISGTFADAVWHESSIGTTASIDTYDSTTDGCVDESHRPDDGVSEPKECSFSALPIRFNDVEIAPGLFLSGELLLRSVRTDLSVRFRGAVPTRVLTSLETGWSATFEIRAEGDVSYTPRELRLWSLELPIFTFSIAGVPITVGIDVDMLLGAEANLHAGATVGVRQATTVGVTMGWDDGERIFEPWSSGESIRTTPPRLTDDTAAHAKAWASLEIALEVEGSAGPYVNAKGYGEMNASPSGLSIDAGVDATAGFRIEIFGMSILDEAFDPWTTSFGIVELGESAGELGGGAGDVGEGELDPAYVTGTDTRWSLALHDFVGNGSHSEADVNALADGGVIIVGRTLHGYIIRLDAEGRPVFSKKYEQGPMPIAAHELTDGSLIVGGTLGQSMWIQELSPEGDERWSSAFELDASTLPLDFAVDERDDGTRRYLLVGSATYTTIRERDPFVISVDESGERVWSRIYETPGADYAYSLAVTSDGHYVLVGATDAQVGRDARANGLVMEIDADGGLVYATAFASTYGATLYSVVEGADGEIWAVGNGGRTVVIDRPTLWVMRFNRATRQGVHVSIEQDFDWEFAIDQRSPAALTPWISTTGGATAYDTGYDVAVDDGALVIVGTTGLGNETAAWALRVHQSLAVEWMTTWDGSSRDGLRSVAVTPTGLVVAGESLSFVRSGDVDMSALVVMKLPFEGRPDLDPSSGAQTRYVQPEVYPTAFDENFLSDGIGSAAVAFQAVDVETTPGDGPVTMTDAPYQERRLDTPPPARDPEPRFVRSDCNGDGIAANLADAIAHLGWVFLGRSAPPCIAACDTNGDGSVTGVSDAIATLGYAFLGAAPPVAPFPDCGEGVLASDAVLGCALQPSACAAN